MNKHFSDMKVCPKLTNSVPLCVNVICVNTQHHIKEKQTKQHYQTRSNSLQAFSGHVATEM